MKIKVVSRSEEEFTRERPTDVVRLQKNVHPSLHPFEKAREYTRALNAVKLDKVFAKPFIGTLSGHMDAVFSSARHPELLSCFASGACDGEIRIWNLPSRQTVWRAPAHKGFVRGLTFGGFATTVLTAGDDKFIKMWSLQPNDTSNPEPVSSIIGKYAFSSIDAMRKSNHFATTGPVVELWDQERTEPVQTYEWGADGFLKAKFNPVETGLLVASGHDRSIVLFDTRLNSALKKFFLPMKTSAICWNPMEAYNFTLGNEDSNCYSFDMRKLDRAFNIHKGHISAVLDLDYSPDGTEFATASFDKTIRIFNVHKGVSETAYFTKRMQRIFTVKYSGDARFILSGSDDTNIRIWKARASEPLHTLLPRERSKLNYFAKLKERYKDLPEIRRIQRHQHLPRTIYKNVKLINQIKNARRRKLKNIQEHTRPGTVKFAPERRKSVIAIQS